ncbi:MAG: hypothetical protein LBQ19_02560 [Synergistaceae bacterium]|jgi:hypothetical protein|nr:hypothetical protein [Synergistaceae bacterium]
MKIKTLIKIVICATLVFVFHAAAFACDDCEEPGMVDGDDAYERSLREGRDPVEGFWGIYLDWHPDGETGGSYRMAIVKNTYGVYPEADYLGVATCNLQGCRKGEVKLLLSKTKKENEFDAALITQKGAAKGPAFLVVADDGREMGALDLREVKYEGRVMAKWMLRIIGG